MAREITVSELTEAAVGQGRDDIEVWIEETASAHRVAYDESRLRPLTLNSLGFTLEVGHKYDVVVRPRHGSDTNKTLHGVVFVWAPVYGSIAPKLAQAKSGNTALDLRWDQTRIISIKEVSG